MKIFMTRRFRAGSGYGLAAGAFLSSLAAVGGATLFPVKQKSAEWTTFDAAGFAAPVTGVIYHTDHPPVSGVPLGGVGTGAIDVDANGIWGYSTIFNPTAEFTYNPKWRMPRKLPAHIEPILGLAIGSNTWVLAPQRFINGSQIVWDTEPHYPGGWVKESKIEKIQAPAITGVRPAKDIAYWGHYPVADMEFETDAPLQVGMRSWSSFLPGNAASSDIPGAVFEVHLRNTSAQEQHGTIAFNFPGPDAQEAMGAEFTRIPVEGNFQGVVVASREGVGYALGTIGQTQARYGAGLSTVANGWSAIGSQLPVTHFREEGGLARYAEGSSSAAVDFSLAAGGEKTVRFLLAWYAPTWEGADRKQEGAQPKKEWKAADWMGDQLHYTHMYASRYTGALDVARRLAATHDDLLRRILAWQSVIYTSEKTPAWLKDSLVNNLHLITADGYWAQPRPPLGDWAAPGGVFAMNESSRGCPHTSCIPCDWYGGLPIVYFFPDLARTTLNAFKQYQRPDGEVPFALGQIGDLPDMASPEFYWQKSLNGTCYIDMVDRLWQRTGEASLLADFYESIKRCNTYTMNLTAKSGHVIRMPDDGGMEWFEHGDWAGMATHMGGLHLAQLRMVERMAKAMGDASYAEQCRQWLAEGQKDMEEKMWNGSYYLNFLDPEAGRKSDDVMAYQLDGEWAARFHGLEGVFRPDRVQTTLATIKRCNVALTPEIGAANFAHADGSALMKKPAEAGADINKANEADVAHYGIYTMFVAEVPILGMTYMGAGERDYGLEMIRKHWENLICRQRLEWDMPNMVDGKTGARLFGTDYYQAMMLWAVPASVLGQDLQTFCAPGGLVNQIITAAAAPSAEPSKATAKN
ncbi:MAG TPA: GH116 family glycosyl-hydrolase [Verrucomicrobiae bacterium]|jgi:uncharacterized protein (DUF608 family)|nr:GH116 family glycosyl-hydrolase [Verrucomicrobiae bacterium]